MLSVIINCYQKELIHSTIIEQGTKGEGEYIGHTLIKDIINSSLAVPLAVGVVAGLAGEVHEADLPSAVP